MLKKRIIWSEIIIQTISVGGGFLIDHFSHQRWYIALTVILALECLLHLLAFFWHYLPAIERISDWVGDASNPIDDFHRLRKQLIPLQHLVPPPEDWPFNEQFGRINQKFAENLQLLAEGSYSEPMEDILEDSIQVCKSMERGAFCTALTVQNSNNLRIFDTDKGEYVKQLQFDAAKRIASANNQDYGFTRLFIFDDLNSISWKNFQLMRENHNNKVEVLVSQKSDVIPLFKKLRREDRMDFGLWRKDLLMEIQGSDEERILHVSKRANDLKDTAELIKVLRKKALSYCDFLQKIKEPTNLEYWSSQPEKTVDLDPPDGPHATDVDKMLGVATTNLKDGDLIAVYGLTKSLIEQAEALKSRPRLKGISIDIVDVRPFTPASAKPGIVFHPKNWLEWCPEKGLYSAAVADDALCNLSYVQTPLFFEKIASCMEPGGRLVFRTTAIFEIGVPQTWSQIVEDLRRFDPADRLFQNGLSLDLLTNGAVVEAAWPTLHTEEFYNPTTKSFSLGKWNERLMSDPTMSVNLKNRLTFSKPLNMTSMSHQTLQALWGGFFKESQLPMSTYSKWESDESLALHPSAKEIGRRFHNYYRIVTLERQGS
jgi:hypothetical protein